MKSKSSIRLVVSMTRCPSLETDCEVSALDGKRRAMVLRRRGTRKDWTAGEDSTTRVPALMMRLSHGCAMDS
jgi:hypothetical protein